MMSRRVARRRWAPVWLLAVLLPVGAIVSSCATVIGLDSVERVEGGVVLDGETLTDSVTPTDHGTHPHPESGGDRSSGGTESGSDSASDSGNKKDSGPKGCNS